MPIAPAHPVVLQLVGMCLLTACASATPASSAPDTARPAVDLCGQETDTLEGEHTLEVDGRTRRYIVRLPSDYDRRATWPLVYALHSNGSGPWFWDLEGTPQQIRSVFANDAVLVIPEAIDAAWRDDDQPSDTWAERVEEELAFFDALHDWMQSEACVREDAVAAMGFSGGGSFSHALGCRRAWVGAIATAGGVLYVDPDTCGPAQPSWVSIGQGELVDGRITLRDEIAQAAACEPLPQEPSVHADETMTCATYSACTTSPVTYCLHDSGHVWPRDGSLAVRDFFREVWTH
jgi:poly(3-hydroxybutyrate) depolymerase